MSKNYHPDVNKEDNASHFLQISEAYKVLGNKRQRALYDSELSIVNIHFIIINIYLFNICDNWKTGKEL